MDVEPALSIRNWACGYLDDPVVSDFSFDLMPGTIACIVGSNGAGKSTLLRSLFGTIKRFAGDLQFHGRPIEKLSATSRMVMGMSFVPQGRCNFPYLAVAETMELATYTLPKAEAALAVEAQVRKFGAPWKGAFFKRVRIPRSNCRSSW